MSPTGKGLTIIPTAWKNLFFQRLNYNRRLKRYYPADLATRSIWYFVTSPDTIHNHLWQSLKRRRIIGCISYMPLIVTVNTVAECHRTDYNILGDKIKKEKSLQQTWQQNNTNVNRPRNFYTIASKIRNRGQSRLVTSFANLNDKLVRSSLFWGVTQHTLVVAGRLGTTCRFHLQSVFGYRRLGTTYQYHFQSVLGYRRLGTTYRYRFQSVVGYRRLGTTYRYRFQSVLGYRRLGTTYRYHFQ